MSLPRLRTLAARSEPFGEQREKVPRFFDISMQPSRHEMVLVFFAAPVPSLHRRP